LVTTVILFIELFDITLSNLWEDPMEGSHIIPCAEIDADEVKRTGEWTWCPADISEDDVAGVTVAACLKVCS
jgi:hypothetical protein